MWKKSPEPENLSEAACVNLSKKLKVNALSIDFYLHIIHCCYLKQQEQTTRTFES
jgi:hypothetical protein